MRLFSQSSLLGGFQTCATKGRRGVDGTWEQTPKAERPPHTRSHIYLHTHEITKCKNPHAATATVLENTHSPNGLAWMFGCCLLVLSFQPFPSGALFTPAPRCLQTLQLHCVLREPFPGHPRKHLLCPGLPQRRPHSQSSPAKLRWGSSSLCMLCSRPSHPDTQVHNLSLTRHGPCTY